jgi:hypothetical protein
MNGIRVFRPVLSKRQGDNEVGTVVEGVAF